MVNSTRLASWVLVSIVAASGCAEDPPAGASEEETGSTSGTTGEDDGPWPISTVTGVTSSGSASSDGSSGSGSDGDDSTGAAIDAAPTVEILLNGSAAPEKITQAGTQVITAIVGDDLGLDRVEIFVDDGAEPFAVALLGGVKDEVVEVELPIYNDEFDGSHELRAVVHDGAMQATEGAPVKFSAQLPEGGEAFWEVVGESVFASKALAVGVDSIGDVIAVGEQATAADGLRSRMVIVKYRGDTGEEVWRREWPTQKDVGTPLGRNVARGVAVDAYDNVYVTGEVRPKGTTRHLWVGKYTFDGLLAETHESPVPMSRGNGIVVDAEGRVFVIGYRYDQQYENVASVDAFDVGLSPLWNDTIAVPDYLDTRIYGAAIDHHGDLVVVGSLRVDNDQNEWQGLVSLYTPQGDRQWFRALVPMLFDANLQQRLFSVVVTDDNEYVCAGRRAVDSDPRALMQVRMGADGEELASDYAPGMSCGDPSFYNDNDVCGVGRAPIGRLVWSGVRGWETDDIEVKQTGAEWPLHYWQAVEPGDGFAIDRGLAVAVDADGYVAAAGYQTPTQGGSPRWWVSRRHP